MPELYQLLEMVAIAGAVYGGIRVDLRNMKEGVKEAKDIGKAAHQRLDDCLLQRRCNDG